MHNNSIRSLLNIPEYKIEEIMSKTDKDIPIKVVLYKRNKGRCSGCGEIHDSIHSEKEITAEDVRLGKRRVFYTFLNNGIFALTTIDIIRKISLGLA